MQVVSSRQRWDEAASVVQRLQVSKLAERRKFSH